MKTFAAAPFSGRYLETAKPSVLAPVAVDRSPGSGGEIA